MAIFKLKTTVSVLATAALLALGVTAYGSQAVGRGNGSKDPTAIGTFEKVSIGGRSGCDVQSWPYIAPECLTPVQGAVVKAGRRV